MPYDASNLTLPMPVLRYLQRDIKPDQGSTPLFTSNKKRRIKAQGSGPFSPPESPKPKTRFTIDGVCVGFPRARTGETAHGSLEVGIFLGTVETGRKERPGEDGRKGTERTR